MERMSGRISVQGQQRNQCENSPKRILSAKPSCSSFAPPKQDFVLCDNNEFPSLTSYSEKGSSDSEAKNQRYSDKLKAPFHGPVKSHTGSFNKNKHSHGSDEQKILSYTFKALPKRPDVEYPEQTKVAGKVAAWKSKDIKTKDNDDSDYLRKNIYRSGNVRLKAVLPNQMASNSNYDGNNNHTHIHGNLRQSLNTSRTSGKVCVSGAKHVMPIVSSANSPSNRETRNKVMLDEVKSSQDGEKSGTVVKASKKKKRKSKIKRQAALQSGKIHLVTAEIHSKILNQSNPSISRSPQTILSDLNNEEEYPELGKVPVSQKKEPKEVLSTSLVEDIKPQISEAAVSEKVIVSYSDKPEVEQSSAKEKKKNKPVHAHDPITLKFLDMLVKKPLKPKEKELKEVIESSVAPSLIKVKPKKDLCNAPNLLDSSGPLIKRGKERENPKPKKPSHLKKIILLDRKLRKEHLLQLKAGDNQEQNVLEQMNKFFDVNELTHLNKCSNVDSQKILTVTSYSDGATESDSCDENVPALSTSASSQHNFPSLSSEISPKVDEKGLELNERLSVEADSSSSNCESPKICLSALDNNDLLLKSFRLSGKTDHSPEKEKSAKILLHTRNFREYCDHLISEDIDKVVHALLDDLARFQDRLHQKDPVKARARKRMIYGVKEVKKYIKLKKLKCVIIAADIENVESEGGLNDMLNDIKMLSKEHGIPCVFALGRKALGKVCHKPVPVSCIGVFNADGSEANLKKIIELVSQSKTDYVNILKDLMSKLTEDEMNTLINARREAPESLHDIRSNILRRLFITSQSDESKTEPFNCEFTDSNDSDPDE